MPDANQLEARDKVKLVDFGKQHDFLVPEDQILYELRELYEIADEIEYPTVVKGKFYDAVIANSFEQAEKAFLQIQAKWGLPIILQEFIKGTEINIAALGDGEGNAISVIPMRKLYITDKGKAWSGVTLEDEKLVDLAKKFINVTKWKGGCELEIMLTDDGEPYIMEVNPRFPAWIYLTAAAGQNQPASLVKMAMGEKLNLFYRL